MKALLVGVGDVGEAIAAGRIPPVTMEAVERTRLSGHQIARYGDHGSRTLGFLNLVSGVRVTPGAQWSPRDWAGFWRLWGEFGGNSGAKSTPGNGRRRTETHERSPGDTAPRLRVGTEPQRASILATASACTPGRTYLFRYDATTDQYIFNRAAKGIEPGTYQLRLDLGDGATRTAIVSAGTRATAACARGRGPGPVSAACTPRTLPRRPRSRRPSSRGAARRSRG